MTPFRCDQPHCTGQHATLRDDEAYDLALLAAQLMSRQSTPANAIRTALDLLKQAHEALDEAELFAPEKLKELDKEREQQRAEYLANVRLTYEQGVRHITGIVGRWDGEYGALNWLKRFLRYKIKSDGSLEPEIEPRVEAHLAKYRTSGFAGTEADKLRTEYERFRNKGTQGGVRRRASDRRLKPVKEKLAAKAAKQAEKEQTARAKMAKREWDKLSNSLVRPDVKFVADTAPEEAEHARHGKTGARGSETLLKDKNAPELLRGQKPDTARDKPANTADDDEPDCESADQSPQLEHE